MSDVYRVRFMELSGRFCLEKRREEKVMGFWPVYRWILQGFYGSRIDAQNAIPIPSPTTQ